MGWDGSVPIVKSPHRAVNPASTTISGDAHEPQYGA
jgi:hypothetical protein